MRAGWAGYAALYASYAILTPYLQLYLRARGFPPSAIGVLLGVFELAGVAGPILVGSLADRLEHYRRFLALALAGAIACFVGLQLTPSMPAALALAAGLGFSYRSTIPILDALMGRVLRDPARQYGTTRVAGSMSFVVVSLVLQATGLVSGEAPVSVLVSFAALAAVAGLVSGVLPPAPRRPAGSPKAAGDGGFGPRFWAVIGVIFLARFGMAAHYSFFSLFLSSRFGISTVSGVWAISAIAEIPAVLFSGRLLSRFSIRTLLAVSLAAITVRLSLYAVAASPALVIAAQALHALTFGTLHTTSVAWVNRSIPPSRRGLGMAIYNAIGLGLASFLASGAGGYVVERIGFPGLFLSYGALPLAGLAVLLGFGRRLLEPRAIRADDPS